MREAIKTNFDKLLVSVMLILVLGALVHLDHYDKLDAGVLETMKSVVTVLTGTLAGLLGGQAMRANVNTKTTDPTTDPPKTETTSTTISQS